MGSQPLAMTADVPWRFVVSYRADARALSRLVPLPLEIDALDGQGFLSVCILRMQSLGPSLFRRAFQFDTYELLVRVGVRLPHWLGSEKSFYTLESQVSSAWMARLGRRFSIYKPRRAEFDVREEGDAITLAASCPSDLRPSLFRAVLQPYATICNDSVFSSKDAAVDFLLGMSAAVDLHGLALRAQEIAHPPWQAAFVEPACRALPVVDRMALRIEAPLTYDSTLVLLNQRQTWQATRLFRPAPMQAQTAVTARR